MSRDQYKLDLAKGQVQSAIDNRKSAQKMMSLAGIFSSASMIAVFITGFDFGAIFVAMVSLSILGFYYRETRDFTAQIGASEAEVLRYEDKIEAKTERKLEW